MDDATQLIHYTNGGPWFEAYQNHPHAEIWYRYRDEYRAQTRRTDRPMTAVPLPAGVAVNMPTMAAR
jgi:hypothetical protein